MRLDTIKSQARHTAWKGDPDNRYSRYNPFIRKSSLPIRKNDEEDPLPQELVEENTATPAYRTETAHTENCVDHPAAHGRTQDDWKEIEMGPRPAQTLPIHSNAVFAMTPNDAEHGYSGPSAGRETKDESSGNTLVPDGTPEDTSQDIQPNRPRKRKLGGLFRKARKGPELEDGDVKEKKKQPKLTVGHQIKAVLFPQWITINWLLVLVPVGIALNYAGNVSGVVIFVVNFLAIIPLAGILSYSTEEIALRVGETLGGLLNATFG